MINETITQAQLLELLRGEGELYALKFETTFDFGYTVHKRHSIIKFGWMETDESESVESYDEECELADEYKVVDSVVHLPHARGKTVSELRIFVLAGADIKTVNDLLK